MRQSRVKRLNHARLLVRLVASTARTASDSDHATHRCSTSAASPMPSRLSAEKSETPMSDSTVAASASTVFAAAQCSSALAAGELVRLRQQDEQLDDAVGDARRYETKQLTIQIGEAKPRIDHQDDAGQAAPQFEVVGHHLLPPQLGAALDRGIAVSGQICQQRIGAVLRADLEQIDVLRAPWRPRSEGKSVLLRQPIDGGRFAGVGSAHECNLRQVRRRQLVELAGRRQESRGVRPSQRSLLAGLASGFDTEEGLEAGDFGSTIRCPNPSL